jgi:hypothetical protein
MVGQNREVEMEMATVVAWIIVGLLALAVLVTQFIDRAEID